MAILSFAAYILIPTFTLAKLLINFEQVRDRDFSAKFGAFYDGLSLKNGKKVLLEPVAFLARRIFLAFLIIYSTKTFIWQILPLLASNLAVMIITFTTGSL